MNSCVSRLALLQQNILKNQIKINCKAKKNLTVIVQRHFQARMDQKTLNECFEHVLKLTKHCGEIIKSAINLSKKIETKESRVDFVTEYDKKIEDILINGIKEKYPNHKFVGEESAYGSKLPELTDDPTWIIDPIDGTTNFMKGVKLNCISIGFAVNKELIAGICYNPCMDEMYTAKKGEGAFLNGEQVHTSKVEKFADALISFSLFGRPFNLPRIRSITTEYMKGSIGFRIYGSMAITLSYVASGIMDAYHIEGGGPWDSAAGIILIEEAGGCVKSITGGKYDIMKPDIIVGSSESVVNEMLEMVQKVEENLKDIQGKKSTL